MVEQIYQAWLSSGKTLKELAKDAGLEMAEASVSRKLRGEQPMSTEECEAFAQALALPALSTAGAR